MSITLDMGLNDFQGHGRDNSGRLTRRTWLFAISLGSTFMMSLAMESIRERRIAVESFAGFVFLGVPHRCSKKATLDRHALRHKRLLGQLAEGSAYLESLPTKFMEQLQRQKEHGRPWHILSFVQTKPFLRGIGEAASRKSAAEYANEIQYCDVAHIDACHIRDSEEAAFKILGQFMKAAESSPLGSFEQTSVALGAPLHQLEGVEGRLTAHAHIAGVGDAVVASTRLQAHGQGVGLTPLAAAGSIGKREVASPQVLNIDGIWVLSPEGGSLSQLVLVTGSGIAMAELQLWEGSGIRCISPLDASDAEHLGAAWILAAGRALAPRLEAVVQLGTEQNVSLPWLVPLGDMARAGHWGMSCVEEPPSPKESAARAVAGTRRAEADSLIRFLQGAELKGPMSEEQYNAATRPEKRKVFLHRRRQSSQQWGSAAAPDQQQDQSPQHIQNLQSQTQHGQHQAAAAVQQQTGGHLAAAGSPTSGVPSSSGEQSVAKRESAAEKERAGASAGITPTSPEHPPPLQARSSSFIREMVGAAVRLLG
ncbi:g424 [Coccomyxa viridis]|uniref:G424 protein n=1 Tax=Coccomyxa viridis TaxID=1274662 RepID=A0ABP1FMB4_9CHLO